MKRGLVAVLTTCVVLVGLFAGAGHSARAASVIGPQFVTRGSGPAILPRMAQDPDGNAHVVWDERNNDAPDVRRVMYAKGTWNGSSYDFGAKYVLANVDGAFGAATPNVAVAPNGIIMVSWSFPDRNTPLGFAQVWDSRSDRPANAPVKLGTGIQSAVAADSASRFHLVWSRPGENGESRIEYCLFDGSFGCSRADALGARGTTANNPDIIVDSTDAVHMVWHTGNDGVQYVVRLKDQNWSVVDRLDGGIAASIGADAQGSVHIAWTRDSKLQYCRKTASSACEERRELTLGDSNRPTIGATPDGQVLLVYLDNRSRTLQYIARESGTWGTPAEVTAGNGPPDVPGRAFIRRSSAVWSSQNDVQLATVDFAASPPPAPPTPVPPPPPPVPPPGPPAPVQPDARCFPETGYCIYGRIREYWEGNGGLAVFGFPISNQARLSTPDGIFDLQVFERERLEYHPENPRPFDVLLGRLGAELLARQGRPWETLPREQPLPGCAFFPETGHNMCEPFLSYWRSVGIELGDDGVSFGESLLLFGLPLTTRAVETNPDGATVETQWFERARFEYYPNNPDGYKVLLGRLGAEAGRP